jgi:hypothetical protein
MNVGLSSWTDNNSISNSSPYEMIIYKVSHEDPQILNEN